MSLSYKLERLRQRMAARWRMLRLRLNPPPMPQNAEGKVYLHIGCGEVYSPEFINIDARKMPHVHIVTEDIFSLNQFRNASVDFVYMSHLLEHVRRSDQQKVLQEMHRVLKPGGVLRLGVPDFDLVIELYNAAGRDIQAIEGVLMGGQDYAYNFHYMVYNRQSLTRALHRAGFAEVRDWDADNAPHHSFHDHSDMRAQWGGKIYKFSLNLEGVK